MGIADAGVDMMRHRAAPATKLIVRAFTGTSLLLLHVVKSRRPDTISIVQGAELLVRLRPATPAARR